MDSLTFLDTLHKNKEVYFIVSNYKNTTENNLIFDTFIYKYCLYNIRDIFMQRNYNIFIYKNSERVQLDLKLSPKKFGRNSGNYDDIFKYWFDEGKLMVKRTIKDGVKVDPKSTIQILK